MLAILLNALGSLLANLAKAWFTQQALTHETEKAGIETEAASIESQANVKVEQAEVARNSVTDLTIDQLPTHNASNDPDFRD